MCLKESNLGRFWTYWRPHDVTRLHLRCSFLSMLITMNPRHVNRLCQLVWTSASQFWDGPQIQVANEFVQLQPGSRARAHVTSTCRASRLPLAKWEASNSKTESSPGSSMESARLSSCDFLMDCMTSTDLNDLNTWTIFTTGSSLGTPSGTSPPIKTVGNKTRCNSCASLTMEAVTSAFNVSSSFSADSSFLALQVLSSTYMVPETFWPGRSFYVLSFCLWLFHLEHGTSVAASHIHHGVASRTSRHKFAGKGEVKRILGCAKRLHWSIIRNSFGSGTGPSQVKISLPRLFIC